MRLSREIRFVAEKKHTEKRAKTAAERGSTFYAVDYTRLNVRSATLDGTLLDFADQRELFVPLLGLYQPRNAAVVLSAIELLRKQGLTIPESAVRQGLAQAVWHARFEKVSHDPLIIFDGAHNPQGIEQAVRSIRHYFGDNKVYLLTGVLRDKDYTGIAQMLSTVSRRAFTLTPDSPRALDAAEYAAVLQTAGVHATPYDTIEQAFLCAKESARADGVPLVCLGSLYVYASLSPLFE